MGYENFADSDLENMVNFTVPFPWGEPTSGFEEFIAAYTTELPIQRFPNDIFEVGLIDRMLDEINPESVGTRFSHEIQLEQGNKVRNVVVEFDGLYPIKICDCRTLKKDLHSGAQVTYTKTFAYFSRGQAPLEQEPPVTEVTYRNIPAPYYETPTYVEIREEDGEVAVRDGWEPTKEVIGCLHRKRPPTKLELNRLCNAREILGESDPTLEEMDLSSLFNIGNLTEAQIQKAVEEYPLLHKYLERIQQGKKLIELSKNRGGKATRNKTIKTAAAELIIYVFEGCKQFKTNRLFNEWLRALHSDVNAYEGHSRGSETLEPEGLLGIVLNMLDINELYRNHPYFEDRAKTLIGRANTNKVIDDTYGITKAMTTLMFIQDKPIKAEHAEATDSSRDIVDALTYLETFAEKIIGEVVIEKLQSNNTVIWAQLSKRILKALKAQVEQNFTQQEVIVRLGLKDTEVLRKTMGRVLGQFSFGRAMGNPTYLREAYIAETGEEQFINDIIAYANALVEYTPPLPKMEKARVGYSRWAVAKSFATSLLALDSFTRSEVILQLRDRTQASNVAKRVSKSKSTIHTFRNTFDRWLLDEDSLEEMFTVTTSLREVHSLYIETLKTIKKHGYFTVLPESAKEILEFMKLYNYLNAQGYSMKEITAKVAEEMIYAPSYVSILHQKAKILADLIAMMEQDKSSRDKILRAWTILNFSDRARKELS